MPPQAGRSELPQAWTGRFSFPDSGIMGTGRQRPSSEVEDLWEKDEGTLGGEEAGTGDERPGLTWLWRPGPAWAWSC